MTRSRKGTRRKQLALFFLATLWASGVLEEQMRTTLMAASFSVNRGGLSKSYHQRHLVLTKQPDPTRRRALPRLFVSSSSPPPENYDDGSPEREEEPKSRNASPDFWSVLNRETDLGKRPDPKVEDFQVLFYDIALLINLVLSISFWDVHRLDVTYIGAAFNEGCLLSICWLLSGLYYGAFLNSAVDGHYGSTDERGGPRAAGMLALSTFIGTINLRLIFSLAIALIQHRTVGSIGGELFIPTELGFGVVLMTAWRALHSNYVPRI